MAHLPGPSHPSCAPKVLWLISLRMCLAKVARQQGWGWPALPAGGHLFCTERTYDENNRTCDSSQVPNLGHFLLQSGGGWSTGRTGKGPVPRGVCSVPNRPSRLTDPAWAPTPNPPPNCVLPRPQTRLPAQPHPRCLEGVRM